MSVNSDRRHRIRWEPMLGALVAVGVARSVPVGLLLAGMIGQGPVSYRWGWRWGAPVAVAAAVAFLLALNAQAFSELDFAFGLVGIAGLSSAVLAASELGYIGKALYQSLLFDPVTKLVNYDFFVMTLHYELVRCERSRLPFSLVLIEIAEFDSLARQRGYRQADIVLREIARIMDGVLRSGDVLARLGGPAFGLLLPMTLADGAPVILDWLRQALRSWQPLTDLLGRPLEWHAAVVQYPTDGQSGDELLSRAETLLNELRPPSQTTLQFEQLVVYARELQQLYRMTRADLSLPHRNPPAIAEASAESRSGGQQW